MILRQLSAITALPLWLHTIFVGVIFAWFQFIKTKLDVSYAASRHPVDYATGQTSFDGTTIKEYYAAMTQSGTLDVYRATQLIDFGFILAIAGLGLVFCTFIARGARPNSWGRHLGLWAGCSFLLGAVCDTVENIISFVMLANPASFANWIALPYSGFAVAKFALITLAMVLLILCILAALMGRTFSKPHVG